MTKYAALVDADRSKEICERMEQVLETQFGPYLHFRSILKQKPRVQPCMRFLTMKRILRLMIKRILLKLFGFVRSLLMGLLLLICLSYYLIVINDKRLYNPSEHNSKVKNAGLLLAVYPFSKRSYFVPRIRKNYVCFM